MGMLVKVVKKPEESEEEITIPNTVVTSNAMPVRPEPHRFSKIGEPVTEEDIVFWKGRQVRVPMVEELTLRLLMEIRDGIGGLHEKLEEVKKAC